MAQCLISEAHGQLSLISLLIILADVITSESQVEQGFSSCDGVLVWIRARYLCSCSREVKLVANDPVSWMSDCFGLEDIIFP
jgi:hypothetical protein